MYIFRAWMTTKDGQRIYAKDHGKNERSVFGLVRDQNPQKRTS